MTKFLLWCLLLVLCWPVALLALVLYPIVWLLLLPFKLLGVAVEGVFELLKAMLLFPARVLRGRPVEPPARSSPDPRVFVSDGSACAFRPFAEASRT